MPCRRRRLGLAVLGAAATAVAVAVLGNRRRDRATDRRVSALYAAGEDRHADTFHPDDVADLPAPVRRYFSAVVRPGEPHTRAVRATQRGAFRLGGPESDWKPLTATQHYAVRPPGFVWDARIEIAPLLSARVVDAYERGAGSLRATVFGVVPVATAAPGPGMNEGELQRYLGEAVWFPTALLPAAGVEWTAVDDRSARATVDDGHTAASLTFHFGDDDLVERVSAPARYRQATDDVAPWHGSVGDYEWRDGVRVPTAASVAWDLPAGDGPYWRARLTSLDRRATPSRPD
jgi:hypothetical protein